jgi:hypothetical protein
VSAVGLLLELGQRGVAVDAAGGRIRCRHAPGALPGELAEQVRVARGEVLALLGDPDALRVAAAAAVFDAEEVLVRCRACGAERGAGTPPCPVCHPPVRTRAGR